MTVRHTGLVAEDPARIVVRNIPTVLGPEAPDDAQSRTPTQPSQQQEVARRARRRGDCRSRASCRRLHHLGGPHRRRIDTHLPDRTRSRRWGRRRAAPSSSPRPDSSGYVRGITTPGRSTWSSSARNSSMTAASLRRSSSSESCSVSSVEHRSEHLGRRARCPAVIGGGGSRIMCRSVATLPDARGGPRPRVCRHGGRPGAPPPSTRTRAARVDLGESLVEAGPLSPR